MSNSTVLTFTHRKMLEKARSTLNNSASSHAKFGHVDLCDAALDSAIDIARVLQVGAPEKPDTEPDRSRPADNAAA